MKTTSLNKSFQVKFTPSVGKEVRFIDENGKVVQVRNINRAERRRLRIYNHK